MMMDIVLNDAELVRQVGAGDREAEAELCRRMGPRIRLYGLRHLRDAHAAEDLTQQVLITTLEALRAGRLREPEKLASFVLGTCRMSARSASQHTKKGTPPGTIWSGSAGSRRIIHTAARP